MDKLNEYYARFSEHTRLTQDRVHNSEFRTTMFLLDQYLQPNSNILDCCAGAGIYAFALAQQGHQVTAGDLIEKHVAIMRQDAQAGSLHEIYQGTVLDMSRFKNETFDAVLCLGALYHLQFEDEQNQAVSECLRTLKKDGLFIFAYMNPFVLYYSQLVKAIKQLDPTEKKKEFHRLSSITLNKRDDTFFGMTAKEAEALVSRFDLELIVNAGTYSTLYPLYPELDTLSEEDFEKYMQCLFMTCTDPNIVAHSMHGCCIARKT